MLKILRVIDLDRNYDETLPSRLNNALISYEGKGYPYSVDFLADLPQEVKELLPDFMNKTFFWTYRCNFIKIYS